MPGRPPQNDQPRADRHQNHLAGQFFVAAELLKRGYKASVTVRSNKAYDLFVRFPESNAGLTVEVRALASPNYFLLGLNDVKKAHIYVFVLLNRPDEDVGYFVVPGRVLADQPARFGKYFEITKMPGIHSNHLDAMNEYSNAWHHFDTK